jgi:hypothetical protein
MPINQNDDTEDYQSLLLEGGVHKDVAKRAGIAWAVCYAIHDCPIGHLVGSGEFNLICQAVYNKETDCAAACIPSHEAFAFAYVKEFADDPDYLRRALAGDETDEDEQAYWARLRKEARI